MRFAGISALLIALCAAAFGGEAAKKAQPGRLDDLLPGVWRGVHSSGPMGYQHFIRVQRGGPAFVGQGLAWFGMPEEQAQAAARGQKPQTDGHSGCYVQQFAIKLEGDTVTFQGVSAQGMTSGKFTPDVFSGTLVAPGTVAGNASSGKKGLFRLAKEEVLAKPAPLSLDKGKTHKLDCLDGGDYHYTCYIPKGYDPARPAPLLINFSPGGNANPLSTKMADEVGWIMIGLTESKNGPWEPVAENRDAALFDCRRRFAIDLKHVYFSGMSGGARAASLSGQTYPGLCAGLILMGAAYAGGVPPPKDQAIFYITGQTDMNKGEVSAAYEKAKSAGRKCDLVIHPGGHDWGRPADHEKAIRWLAEQTLGAKPDDKKRP